MQLDPIKPTLKVPGTKRSKLKCDKPLSNFAFKINLRRYIEAELTVFSSLEAKRLEHQLEARPARQTLNPKPKTQNLNPIKPKP